MTMRDRITRRPKVERPEASAKPAARMGKGKQQPLTKVLEEWLAEARIRYTHAGD
jgi:hypothetical protein